MGVDPSSVVLFFIALAATVAVILAATIFARWLRTKIIWTPFGRWLCRLGFSRANGTIDDLRQGRRYIVIKNFVDHHGGRFEVGEGFTFLRKDYLPYHSGHAIFFEERTLYLQDEENAEILENIWAYLEPARR